MSLSTPFLLSMWAPPSINLGLTRVCYRKAQFCSTDPETVCFLIFNKMRIILYTSFCPRGYLLYIGHLVLLAPGVHWVDTRVFGWGQPGVHWDKTTRYMLGNDHQMSLTLGGFVQWTSQRDTRGPPGVWLEATWWPLEKNHQVYTG